MTQEEKTPAPENKPEPAAKEVAPSPEAPQAGKKNNKINMMSLKEIEVKAQEVKEKMGNLKSRYAKQLLKQKDILTKGQTEK